ncbi:MAG: FHA domain-containing protein [Anaerolineaceae bacterium]|nr:FHA domain-containing protein [Anaerolineaceae bacterium]
MAIQKFTLHIKSGGEWEQQALDYGIYVLGRIEQADIVLASPNISRKHAQLKLSAEGAALMDLGSSNGTQLSGTPLPPREEVLLQPDQVFMIGPYELKLTWERSVPVAGDATYVEDATSFRPPKPLTVDRMQVEPPAAFVVQIENADGNAEEIQLGEGTYSIGRTSTSDIQLDDSKVSRNHATLELRKGRLLITDLGSANGTLLDGKDLQPNEPSPLELGHQIRVADFNIRVSAGKTAGESAAAPAATQIDTPARSSATEVIGAPLEEASEAAGATFVEAMDRTTVQPGSAMEDRTEVDGSAAPEQIIHTEGGVVLRFRKGNGAWDQITLRPGEYVLGRTVQADLVLSESQVSRRHAQLFVGEDGCFLMDLGSANGTQVDGNPLRPRVKVPLSCGQSISIANYTLALEELGGGDVTAIEVGKTELGKTVMGATQVAFQSPILRYQQGSGPWQEFTLMPGAQILGRSSEAQLRIPSETISRHHARLMVQDQHVWVADLHSKNGITMNGRRLPPEQNVELHSGDRFYINDFCFEYASGEASLMPMQPVSGASSTCILEPGMMDAVLNMPMTGNMPDATMVGADLGLDMAMIGAKAAQAPVNLAGHERVTIGRDKDNMIVFSHPLVSRYHAVIERMGTRTRITDLHSANGTYVNEQAITGTDWLKQGDVIKIGPYVITFTGNELYPAHEESYQIDVVGLQKWVTPEINLLKEISLSIGQNEFVALVGMSGAGKSTLMDAINGFRPATDGQVFINGTELYNNYALFCDDIGNVPQKDIVHMELTAEQALDYAAQLRMPQDTSLQERKTAVAETLDDLGLQYRKDVRISRLSGGQLKRVSIGVELLTKPRLFFLDEPTSGLDPGTEYEMMKLLRRLADQGRTIMIITHATKNVMFCDKAIILAKGGNLAFYGPPEDALEYFDQFRTKRERLEKDMEFDDIYRILNDADRGTPEEWRMRYLQSPYARFTQPQAQAAYRPQAAAAPAGTGRQQIGKRISGLKQFFILSSRYLRTMVQDKASLILTLTLAPLLGLMNFIWGNKLFDPVSGNAAKTMGIWFATSIMGILVGYMGSIQELVKEKEIYKRERAVGLKILPYIMSKVWVGAALSFYQAFFILIFTVILTQPAVESFTGYLSMYVTLLMVIFCSFILGLLISAVSPNPNTAQLIMIATFVPQVLLSGVLQPLHLIVGGEIMSPVVVARWGYENFVNSTGMGNPLINDPCWSDLEKDLRSNLTADQKEKLCSCMGPQLFQNCGSIPGILSEDIYDTEAQQVLAMNRPEQPLEPDRLPTPTPRNTPTVLPSPTFYPSPTYLPTPTPFDTPTPVPAVIGYNSNACPDDKYGEGYTAEKEQCVINYIDWKVKAYEQTRQAQYEEYAATREAQFVTYKDDTFNQFEGYKEDVGGQFDVYKEDVGDQIEVIANEEREIMEVYADENYDIFNLYKDQMEVYSDDLSYYERTRQEAIASAEAILTMLWDDYGRAFRGNIFTRLFYIGLITSAQFIFLLIAMKRKDTI